MITNNVFISNLAKACQKNNFLTEEGKKLGIFHRISHIFTKKDVENEFKLVCKRLSDITNLEDISVTTSQQLDILIRLKKIKDKIKDKTIQAECQGYLESFENLMLNEGTVESCVSIIFKEINSDLEKSKTRKLHKDLEKMLTVVKHFNKEEQSLKKIISSWNDFNKVIYSEKIKLDCNSQIYLPSSLRKYIMHEKLMTKKLLNAEEKILKQNNTTENLNEYTALS